MQVPYGIDRRAFTLIELLLVLGIAMIVLALIIPATMTIFQTVRETQTRAEIKSLDEACELFKFKYGRYPPSNLILKEKGFGADGAGDDGKWTVETVFKGIDTELYVTSQGKEWHDWNGNGRVDDERIHLMGYECLVFLLGGMPEYDPATDQVRLTGFNMDSTRPTRKSAGSTRSGPFFEFDPKRLVIVPYEGSTKETHPFPVYRDPFGTPYMYFCAKPIKHLNLGAKTNPYSVSDCAGAVWLWEHLGKNGVPWAPGPRHMSLPEDNFNWYQEKRFQIISAGADCSFGNYGLWPSHNPNGDEVANWKRTRDDITNFSEGRMDRLLK